MSLPAIIPFVKPPDRAAAGSDFGVALAAWISSLNLSVESYNAYVTAVQAQTPDAIGALGLSTQSEVVVGGAVTLTSAAFGKMHTCTGAVDYPVTLPAAAGNSGKLIGFRIANGFSKLVTLDGSASELIDSAATRIMWAGESAILLCDGTGWAKVAGRTLPMVCRMQGPDSQSIAGSTYTNLTLSAAILNVGALADIPNNRIVMKRPCICLVSSQFSLQALPPTVGAGFQILLNGGHLNYGGGTGLFTGTTPTTDILISVAAGATLSMRGYHANTSNLLTSNGTFLNVTEIVQW